MNATEEQCLTKIMAVKCYCCFCRPLQQKVKEEGVHAIKNFHGMICGAVEAMLEIYREYFPTKPEDE